MQRGTGGVEWICLFFAASVSNLLHCVKLRLQNMERGKTQHFQQGLHLQDLAQASFKPLGEQPGFV